jgi:hypothetical protein
MDVFALVRHYYELPGNAAGGALHIVLDDGNLSLDHLLFCREQAAAAHDNLGVQIADLLAAMPMAARARVLTLQRSLPPAHLSGERRPKQSKPFDREATKPLPLEAEVF